MKFISVSKKFKNTKCNTDLKVHDNVMKVAKEAKYPGDIINEQGNGGIVHQISSMLSNMSYVEIALVLRESHLLMVP